MREKYIHHTHSYLNLRSAVGWIGLLLPFVLALGSLLLGGSEGVERSISYYYHTVMGDVFVGALCAVALFLFFYAGYGKIDDWAGNVAGLFLVGTAWFPTTQHGPADTIGTVHLICAAGFFITVSFFSLFLFTRTDDKATMSPRKKIRNGIYIVCGLVILVALVAILLHIILTSNDETGFVFVCETIALIAFGTSWLTKAETLYPDKRRMS